MDFEAGALLAPAVWIQSTANYSARSMEARSIRMVRTKPGSAAHNANPTIASGGSMATPVSAHPKVRCNEKRPTAERRLDGEFVTNVGTLLTRAQQAFRKEYIKRYGHE
jgi:hypothetical protein